MDRLTALHIVAYAFGTVAYLAFHVGGGERAARVGRLAVAAGWIVHFVDIGARCLRGQHPASSTTEAMAFVALLVIGGFLAGSLRYRLQAAGAFAVPAGLALLVLARVVPGGGEPTPAASGLGIAHIILATVGVAVFASAAVLAALYLYQERQLKRRQFGLMKVGSAPLDTLDRLSAACVKLGFPVFTLAILTGALWVAHLGILRTGKVRPEYALAVASWVAFGGLLLARAVGGWQGRRAAWLTVGGFSGALLVLVAYLLRYAA
jgi:ABC-type uncharacterized transport system permease subunit